MRNTCVSILSAADTATVNGGATDANQIVSASFQSIFGDVTAVGTIKIQASNDPTLGQPRANFTPTNWTDIPSASAAVAAGVAPLILIPNMAFSWVRAVYTRTSGGSTTVVVNMNALSI